jgi:uncharacterized protein
MRTPSVLIAFSLLSASTFAEDLRPRITVSAQSEIRVVPDEAIIGVLIQTLDPKSIPPAKARNDQLSAKLVKAIRDKEVPEAGLRVTDFSAERHFRDYSRPDGYEVNRQFEIRTEDFSKIEPILAVSLELSDSEVHVEQLKLHVRDQRKHQVEARSLAVLYAHEKASHLAQLNDRKLGAAIEIKEDIEYSPNSGSGFGFGGQASLDCPNANPLAVDRRPSGQENSQVMRLINFQEKSDEKPDAKDVEAARELLLSPGQVTLNASVTITYELLPKE